MYYLIFRTDKEYEEGSLAKHTNALIHDPMKTPEHVDGDDELYDAMTKAKEEANRSNSKVMVFGIIEERLWPVEPDEPEWMDQQPYLDCVGMLCPRCRSENIKGGLLESDGRTVLGHAECLDCAAGWLEKFELAGYERKE